MGSLLAAQADIDCAKLIDPAYVAGQEPELQSLLSAARAKHNADSATALADEWIAAAASSKTDDELTAIAEPLQRIRLAKRFIPQEQFTREYCRLFHIANDDPASTDKMLDLTGFLVRPTISSEVAIDGKTVAASIPCGQPDLDTASHLLAAVLRAHPTNLRALEQSALLLSLQGNTDAMISVVNAALNAGSLDPDLVRLNLNYCTSLADQDLDKSRQLRTAWTSSSPGVVNGKSITHIHTHTPTADDLNEADRLEQESKTLRVQAHNPLARLINSTQNKSDPITKATNAIAWAEHWEWLGENQKAVGAAVAAVEAQPTNLAALDYLIELCPKVGLPELGLKYQDQKEALSNPCPNALLRAFRADMKNNNDPAARADLDHAEANDPFSVAVQMARLDFAVHRQDAGDIVARSRLIVAMEAARLRIGGRSFDPDSSSTLSVDDIRISTLACLIAGAALEQTGQEPQALTEYDHGLTIAQRAPFTQIADPASIKAPPLCSQPNLGPEDRAVSLQRAIYDAHRHCACRLLMRDDPAAALPHCVAMLRLTRAPEADGIAERIGYLIYQKLSWPALPQPLPACWQSDFSQLDKAPIQFTASSLLNQETAPNPRHAPAGNPPSNIRRAPDGSRYRLAQ
jgi:hypothetical protein